MRLGFIGTGTLTAAIVAGIRSRGLPHEILLSPRSETTSTKLAAQYPGIVRAPSNAFVAEHSDVVFLAMRPMQVEAALKDVGFQAGQTVVSFVTGLSVQELAALAPHSSVCRVLPLPAIAYGKGPIICHPTLPAIAELFAHLGEVIPAESERQLQAFGCVSGFMSSYFELQQSLGHWLEGQDIPASHASLYVRSMLDGLAHTAVHTSAGDEPSLPEEHETKGGLNERVRKHLRAQGWFDAPGQAFQTLQKLSRSSLD